MRLHLIAHNLRSAENVGSLFRTCDALGVAKLWLTGYSPTPLHPKVAKTALGAERSVIWEQGSEVLEVVVRLRGGGFRVTALETASHTTPLTEYRIHPKIALLVGNEVTGLTPSILKLCDDVVRIPQCGIKESLNVAVAAGIAVHWLMHQRASSPRDTSFDFQGETC